MTTTRYYLADDTDYTGPGKAWLLFDRQGVGCLAQLTSLLTAELMVAALNAFDATPAAAAYEQSAWIIAKRSEDVWVHLGRMTHDEALTDVDVVRAAYLHDPTITNEHYGQLVTDADAADQARENAAEKPDDDVCSDPGCTDDTPCDDCSGFEPVDEQRRRLQRRRLPLSDPIDPRWTI